MKRAWRHRLMQVIIACVIWGGLAFYLTNSWPFVARLAQAASFPEHILTLSGLRRVAGPEQSVNSFLSRLTTGAPASPAALAVDEGILSASMRQRLPTLRDLLADSGYDPLLRVRGEPDAFTVRDTSVRGDRAVVTVDTRIGLEVQALCFDLVLEDGSWRLDRVRLDLPPERVVDNFYSWYLYHARTGSLPDLGLTATEPRALITDGFLGWYLYYAGAASAAGGDAPVFTADFARAIAKAASSSTDGATDPVLLSSEMPSGVAVESVTSSADRAKVYLRSDLEGHRLEVSLVRVDGVWQIDGISRADEAGAADTPGGAVAAFYAWYLSPLPAHMRTEGAYRYSEHLAPELVAKLDATGAQAGSDPLLCSTDVPNGVSVVASEVDGQSARVAVSNDAGTALSVVELRQVDGRWLIYNVSCSTP